jgi:dipeptidyl aminopeptidase/acylaminoacyl peptidase
VSVWRLATRVVLASFLVAPPASGLTPERVAVPSADGTALDAVLLRPAGDGPHPAVILLHGCGRRDARSGCSIHSLPTGPGVS